MEIIYKDYLDYSLQILSENFSDGLILSDLRTGYKEKTGKLIESETQKHFEKYYEGKFFERVGNKYKHKILSDTQTKILTYGSFSAYLDELKKKQEAQEKIQQIQNKKLEDDAKLSKWQVRTFWWFFGFSLVSLCYGVYDFITDLNSDKSLDRIELSNQQLESELSKLRTLVLDQKTVDSLHNSKTDVESLNKK